MQVTLTTPDPGRVHDAVRALATWQRDDEPLQLHPGDVGWLWRRGADHVADALRTWSVDGRLVALGMLDGADLLRVTTDPAWRQDAALASAMAEDIARPDRGVLPAGAACIEVPAGALLDARLADAGWQRGEAWTPLQRDLAAPVEAPGADRPLRVVEVDGTDAALVSAWTAVQRSAFDTAAGVDERWYAMAEGPRFEAAACLLGFDGDAPAAGIIAWSAGEGRPGLIEPMGVHRDHRGRGHARAITIAAAAALRERGASSAQVCTESERVAAVATYRSAGFAAMPERFDRERES